VDAFVASVFGIVAAFGGFFIKWLWDWGVKKVELGQKSKEEGLKDRIDAIGGEIKSRISSLEFRHRELEQTFLQVKTELMDFRKDVTFALKTQRETGQKLYEGVKEIIKKADERYEKIHGEVKVLKDTIEAVDWKKYAK
jgi:hypothetical protein